MCPSGWHGWVSLQTSFPSLAKPNGNWDSTPIHEAKLGQAEGFLSKDQRLEVTNWWLAEPEGANTPNWDIASTCKIGDSRGLLLVEAKAHRAELKTEAKPLADDAPAPSCKNHQQIQNAIAEASLELSKVLAGWNLSCDSHYQLANRFAWAWKLASMDISVVLIYLGFLHATEMSDLSEPFADSADWSRFLLVHSQKIVPEQAWGRDIRVGRALIKPLIRASTQAFSSVRLT